MNMNIRVETRLVEKKEQVGQGVILGFQVRNSTDIHRFVVSREEARGREIGDSYVIFVMTDESQKDA